ncbi:DEAD/DEAH box helicase [Dermabacteraceae bacterium P13095]
MAGKHLNITFDEAEIAAVSADFDLRAPNREALTVLVRTLAEPGGYDPATVQVMNLATGVGKTYLMAAFMEYLRRQGVRNVMVVTPSLTVQNKTVQNFTPGHRRHIRGAAVAPEVTTPQDYSAWRTSQATASGNDAAPRLVADHQAPLMAFIFNIHQLIAPKQLDGATSGGTARAAATRIRRFSEDSGVLLEHLKSLPDLVVIADESHLYSSSAKAFYAALKELDPAATIGLTASASSADHVIYRYPLYRAIQDRYVKTPVLAFRKSGYGEDQASEEQQLRDAVSLLATKRSAYRAHTLASGLPELNPVLFVVCSDVSHASQVAVLLRSGEYFGSETAVLQVDNKHSDEKTLHALENLDHPSSPVRAVVSVNKLKEGWDVKNIAVVVTLRAMASEVLTQQTMGRGLRLPFGSYTGNLHIDQLDIISHRSFKELLAAENVLQQFGLSDDLPAPEREQAARALRCAARAGFAAPAIDGRVGAETSAPDPSALLPGDPEARWENATAREAALPGELLIHPDSGAAPLGADGGIGIAGAGGGVLIAALDDDTQIVPLAEEEEPIYVPRNPRFADVDFAFPRTTMRMENMTFELSVLSEAEIAAAARRVTTTGDFLSRKEIVSTVQRRLKVVDTEGAEIAGVPVEPEQARRELLRLALSLRTLPATPENRRLLERYLIPRFMEHAPLERWTVKALASAQRELQDLVSGKIRELERKRVEQVQIHPMLLPKDTGYRLRPGEQVLEQVEDRRAFQARAHYGGWFKGIFEVESFDSYSGEYLLAKLLNTSPSIRWWLRLHPQMGASIQYNLAQNYYPDFVAQDTGGVYWIIEGKSVRGRTDSEVQAKRERAEELVRKLIAHDSYADQRWGYLIAYEDDVARADSWTDLCGMAAPVVTP